MYLSISLITDSDVSLGLDDVHRVNVRRFWRK